MTCTESGSPTAHRESVAGRSTAGWAGLQGGRRRGGRLARATRAQAAGPEGHADLGRRPGPLGDLGAKSTEDLPCSDRAGYPSAALARVGKLPGRPPAAPARPRPVVAVGHRLSAGGLPARPPPAAAARS